MSRFVNVYMLAIVCLAISCLTIMSHAGDSTDLVRGPVPNTCSYPMPGQFPSVNTMNTVRQSHGYPSGNYHSSGEDKLVPVTYVEPGPIRAVAFYAVGLIKATIAAPFKLVETVIPLGKKTDCHPVARGPVCAPPAQSQALPTNASCAPVPVGCGPPSPYLGPRPRSNAQNNCGPNLPPQVVKEYEFPPKESDNLLSGLWNLPATLVRQGRFTGDLFRNDSNSSQTSSR